MRAEQATLCHERIQRGIQACRSPPTPITPRVPRIFVYSRTEDPGRAAAIPPPPPPLPQPVPQYARPHLVLQVPFHVYSKEGQLPGFRSSVSVVPALGIGVFAAALRTTTPDVTVDTVPALSALAPALVAVLQDREPRRRPPPARAASLVGTYYLNTTVRFEDLELVVSVEGAAALTLSPFVEADVSAGDERWYPVRAHKRGVRKSCRWLDDGSDAEVVYFVFAADAAEASGLVFMGERLNRV